MKKLITVVELTPFLHAVQDIGDDAERASFTTYIAENYEDGDLIQGTGGLRKLRWKRPCIGKRGGVRIIYYYYDQQAPVYLITAFAKNEKENLTNEDKKYLAALTAQLKIEIKNKRRGDYNEK
ncbi:MAG: type II toxin-antitoxin system RelE/ParE family toxin [Negativicutes bacterium]